MFNPEGDMGDVEMWELHQADDLPRRRGQAEHGGRRSPPRRLLLRDPAVLEGTDSFEIQNIGAGTMTSQPGSWVATRRRPATATTSATPTSSSSPEAALPYPVRDGNPEDSQTDAMIDGRRASTSRR